MEFSGLAGLAWRCWRSYCFGLHVYTTRFYGLSIYLTLHLDSTMVRNDHPYMYGYDNDPRLACSSHQGVMQPTRQPDASPPALACICTALSCCAAVPLQDLNPLLD